MNKIDDIKLFILSKKYWLIGVVFVLLVISCLYFLLFNSNDDSNEELIDDSLINNIEESNNDDSLENCMVSVDIKGEVISPGLYKIECDKRVQDVIELAGGLKNDADTSILNLSKKVFDEMVIVIYSKTEVNNFVDIKDKEVKKEDNCKNNTEIKNDACIENKNKITTTVTVTEEKIDNENNTDNSEKVLQPNSININSADQKELTRLPGIGDSKALKIIAYRNEVGLFKTIDEIKNVKGIGNSIFEKIKPYITV
ncbi:MAG: helix-hairpin-helix domain-containing protein [Tenericutes bacterium]|nr:helix-hairpin-helix domain-containing protein [Mycoplasmatota bacterium]